MRILAYIVQGLLHAMGPEISKEAHVREGCFGRLRRKLTEPHGHSGHSLFSNLFRFDFFRWHIHPCFFGT